MNTFASKIVGRGAVLMDANSQKVYVLVRESRPVEDFAGNKLYSYNLQNVENGKLRRTTNSTPFGNDPLTVDALSKAFGLSLVPMTDLATIGKQIRAAAAKAVLPTVNAVKAMGRIVRDATAPTLSTNTRIYVC